MANSYKGNPIVLDTFSAAIDLNTSLGFPTGTRFKINSIEWQEPAASTDTAVLTTDNGDTIFDETCINATQSIIKYFHGAWIQNIKIGISGVSSGKIVIILV